MRSPSARVLINTVNIFVAPPGRDNDGGAQFPYPPTPTYANISCSVQPIDFDEIIDDQNRLTQIYGYKIIFSADPPPTGLTPRDLIVWVDSLNITHNLFFAAQRDNAGRNSAYTIRAVERI